MAGRALRATSASLALALAACGSSDPCALGAPGAPWIAFTAAAGGRQQLHLLRADGSCLAALGATAGDALQPSWSPAGLVAYAHRDGATLGLRLADPRTGADRQLDVGLPEATAPALSPDGATLAFEGREAGAAAPDLWLAPAAGGPARRLTGGQGRNGGPAWSPDGAWLYFASDRGGTWEVWRVAAAGGAPAQVTTGAGLLGRPALSPDGTRLAFTTPRPGGWGVRVLALATGAAADLPGLQDAEPAWSPDGATLLVTSWRAGGADLWLVDASSGEPRARLTSGPAAGGGAFAPAPLF